MKNVKVIIFCKGGRVFTKDYEIKGIDEFYKKKYAYELNTVLELGDKGIAREIYVTDNNNNFLLSEETSILAKKVYLIDTHIVYESSIRKAILKANSKRENPSIKIIHGKNILTIRG